MAYSNEQQKLQHLEKGVEAARLALKLSEYQYTTGMTDFNDVLDAQRSLLTYEDTISQSRGAVLSDLIKIYKTLGGGWSSMTAEHSLNTLHNTSDSVSSEADTQEQNNE